MRHFILTGHSKISEGMASAAELITGIKVPFYNAYIEGAEPFEEKIREEISGYPADDEIIIMTDMIGGSVDNEMMQMIKYPNVHLVTSVNLAFVIQVILSDEKRDIVEIINETLNEAKESMKYCNELTVTDELDEF